MSVTVQAPAASVRIGESLTYTATVTGSTNTAVTWTVAGAGCTGAACGTISGAGVYTAPAIVPVPPQLSVTATSQADATKSASAAVAIGSDVALDVWPQRARVTLNNSRHFLRMLTGSANDAVVWSVAGLGCPSTDCGSVDAAGLYRAPAVMPPNTVTVFVVATSVTDRGKTAQAEVTLQSSNNATVNGGYAYLNRGVSLGAEGVSAGAFVADAAGSLSGVLDRVLPPGAGGKLVNLAHGGRYSLGSDNMGDLTFALPGGDNAWRTSVSADGNLIFMQPVFNPDVRTMAQVYKQDPSASGNSAVSGSYVFQLDGADAAGKRVASIGRFTANAAGAISAGVLEHNDGGALAGTTFTGSYSVSNNGRAPMQWVTPTATYHFALYVVSGNQLIIVSIDDVAAGVPMRVGQAWRQTGGPFGAASLSGNYVFDLIGRNSASSAIATVGRFVADGAGAASGRLDRNDNYALNLDAAYTATYTVDANGRGQITSTALPATVFYLVSPDKALLMEAPNARVQTGTLQRQRSAPYATANLIGHFAQGSTAPALVSSLTVTARAFYGGNGSGSSVQDVNASPPCGLYIGANTSGTRYTVSATGRINILDSGGGQLAAGHLIDPGRYVLQLQRPSGGACDEVVHNYQAQQ